MGARERLDLLDWRRRVAELYASVRADPDREAAWHRWRAERDRLFGEHPQSPLPRERRAGFGGLSYFPYDPAARVLASVEETEPEPVGVATSGPETYAFTKIGVARFELGGRELTLDVHWLEGYGGGVFVPFRDATAGTETYGAGRYLLDTVKGADLGTDGDGLVFDFNFAYHPSCAHDPRWTCPLAPAGNRLDVPVRAGERLAG